MKGELMSRRVYVSALAGVMALGGIGVNTAQAVPVRDLADVSVLSAHRADAVSGGCTDWNRAVGVPGRWSRELKNGCGVAGYRGYKVTYSWSAERGTPCIKVKGFRGGARKWYNAGCGKIGAITVPWGNTIANKGIKVKGASLFVWR
ncbi:hypothetical protein ACFY8B_32800 [Streptomyces sp. NPDC012751]|uniref:hypothetical protein n=1 Tax=Streptomyces sp. NPDC012751 TaxID=3364846 RepID=UPI0036CDD58E